MNLLRRRKAGAILGASIVLFAAVLVPLVWRRDGGSVPAPASESYAAARPASLPAAPPELSFADEAEARGLRFVHENGMRGEKLYPETLGSGGAFADVDGDGDPDVLLLNARVLGRGEAGSGGPTQALFRNDGGKFTDITRAAGLDLVRAAFGCAAADVDADGDTDLFLACLDGDLLLRNDGGRFTDVTRASGLAGAADPGDPDIRPWSTSAAFLDYDADGWPDLFVCRYVRWSVRTNIRKILYGTTPAFPKPDVYPGGTCALLRNRGDGTFEDVTASAGILRPSAKALGVAVVDLHDDGLMDLVVANDTEPNFVFRNLGGRFEECGEELGIAFAEGGRARAGMGIDGLVLPDCGRLGIAIGNFSQEPLSLFIEEAPEAFVDAAARRRLAGPSLRALTFGLLFLDVDLDGWPDIVTANGHIEPEIGKIQDAISWAQAPQLFWNAGGRTFHDISATAGPAFTTQVVGRGLAAADIDGDGDLDLLLTTNGGPVRLLVNRGAPRNHWLRVRLVGRGPGRDALGARVTVETEDGRRQVRLVRTGSSYLSQSELVQTFGLGGRTTVRRLHVRWPGGAVTELADVAADREIAIREP